MVVIRRKAQEWRSAFKSVSYTHLEIMGQHCLEEFDGYFPVRFNYDDTWHSNGNMSVQVHPDEDFVIENYDEFGRQDEAYYVIATGHGAKTYCLSLIHI